MKNYTVIALSGLLLFTLSSCEAIGAIFKAGVWTGIFVVAIVIALIIFIARSFSSKK